MNKKIVLVLISSILLFPLNIDAARGCCSHHGGVSGCSSSGRQICKDGTMSPSCACTPVITYIYGREDKKKLIIILTMIKMMEVVIFLLMMI